MKRELLSDAAVATALADLPGWSHVDGALTRTFEFNSFVQAFGFMASVALIAEKLDHHPDWSNVYSTVNIAISTHDRGGVTEFDLAFALAVSAL